MRYFILLFFLMNLLSAGEKVALLIGNTQYQFQPLSNPINDVRAIKKTLLDIGFRESNIKTLENASQSEMTKALFAFGQKASKAEIALVYFSGHGIQVNNTNYMFPANTTAKTPLDLMGLVDLNYFIDGASNAKYGIVLVDACRNNPLIDYFQSGRHKGSRAKKGLGQVSPKREQIVIGFATDAGNTADDGKGGNSPYVKALTRNLKLNLDIRKVLGQVGLDVSKATDNGQNPILKSTLGRFDVCLTGNCGTDNQDEMRRLQEENDRLKRGGNERKKINDDETTINTPSSNNSIQIVNNLIYQNHPFRKKSNWNEAERYCQNLDANGYSNWRLPTRYELKILGNIEIYTYDTEQNWKKWLRNNNHQKQKSLNGNSYFITKRFINNLPTNSRFWSSTSYSYNNSAAWFVDFSKGYEDWQDKNSQCFVLCVKSGR